MPKYFIQTYGCQMNYSDTERMETYLEALGFEKSKKLEDTDLAIFNSCSVRQKAEDRVIGAMKNMKKLRKTNSNLKVILTGCMIRETSSRYSEKRDKLFNRIPEMDIALRIEELPKLAELFREIDPNSQIKAIPEENLENYFMIQPNYISKNQAFVPVSTGCDKFCTYCIVPYSRGREHSRPMQEILKECEQLVENGCLEITLLGQTVNSYGLGMADKQAKTFKDKEPFVHLLEKLDKLSSKGLKRVRFTSSHPKDMSDQLIDAMANLKTQMPYLHLPLQSGDNRTLKRMNRPYTVEQYRKIIEKLRTAVPGISITTDMIVGFCDETDEEFARSYKFFEEMGFEHGYISRYSDRKGTFAHKYLKDSVDPEVKKERWERMNALLKKLSKKSLKRFKDSHCEVLVETCDKGLCEGRNEHFKTVEFKAPEKSPATKESPCGRKNHKKNARESQAKSKTQEDLIGTLQPIRVTEALDWSLKGELSPGTAGRNPKKVHTENPNLTLPPLQKLLWRAPIP